MVDDRALLQATSGAAIRARTAAIVLRWESAAAGFGYRLLRRAAPGGDAEVVGPETIRAPASAAELREIVAEGSPDWEALARLLTSARTGSSPGDGQPLTDPAEAFDRGLTETEARFVQAAAQANLTMGRIAGLAYIDRLRGGTTAYYELRGVDVDGTELVLASDVAVVGGVFTLPAPPSGLTVQVGDRRALVLWNRNPHAATYLVERAIAPGGPFVQINPLPVAYDLAEGIDGTALLPEQPGFLDLGAWRPDGTPTTRLVGANVVDGPDTGVTYYYRVASRDTLDRVGAWSPTVTATPLRSLAPMAPDELEVTPTTAATGLTVRWRTVTRNVEDHAFVHLGGPDTAQTNLIYRAQRREDLEDIAALPSLLVATVVSDPSDVTHPRQSFTDTDPILRPLYGTTTFYYRVLVVDAFGVTSAPSAIIGGAVPDITPPGPTSITGAKGEADHIRLEWQPNGEPDVGGYQVYRGVCDLGYVYVPGIDRTPKDDKDPDRPNDHPNDDKGRYTCDMTLVGEVTLGAANTMFAQDGVIAFDDVTVPADSPICYAYWVRAYDHTGNLYPVDGPACPKPGEYVCASLREKTPPKAPVLTAMRARNHGVELEWIGAPEQDLRAFHVYRSDTEFGAPVFLASVLTDGTVSTLPWKGALPNCAAIPAVLQPLAAHGTYLDADAEPHTVYWYRVSALDWLGSESEGAGLAQLPSSATFTFTSDLPVTPALLPPVPPATDVCGLDVTWGPTYDPATLTGFVVFRAAAVGAPYRQVSGVLTDNVFSDATARRGVDYLYRVQSLDLVGTLSEPSAPVLHRY